MSESLLTELVGKPLLEWPDEVFDQFGIKNPNKPSNISIVLDAIIATVAVPGDIVECGVYRGSSLATFGLKVRGLGLDKQVWGLDSFAGFPPASEEDLIDGVLSEKSRPSYYANANEELVRNLIRQLGLDDIVNIVAGYFEDTCPSLSVEAISVLWLDCDLYGSYKTCLEHLYPRVSSGGYIIFDEYYSKKYPGARIAVDEFFADKPEKPVLAEEYLRYSEYERWHLVKK